VPAEVFQALELAPGALRELQALVRYQEAFARI
jgi:predicted N-acetyltransferase YhbS